MHADGKPYAIGFQMRLPANWNGKFLFQGGGGPALDDFDPLTALENWHERGQASESMLAKGKAFAGKSQPLCAYPKIAIYVRGDENDANSFVCK
ncbi:tannase/feruloyl esterase family alpha/beta hydrolase [Kingella kingae]|uniref:tannase/feruloyl esterase family alpha/beta hydrolase n=1 Tax=Kingella kingae TaxID=504 RepID=UPI00050A2D1F|nr:tannase/feruloyl esterase family alpha/beta hydrolase [Kingella kingae]MDK4526036.1 tannase/feruloyl esterase family alpha/beta hydrolase [Kingella kingae]MDK4528099.1 tannase/feruloyl esterase family alpha/beta hydrolase [Kingella kingae]MDK4532098.1 tannase/feruloyl esterase family alpha/beta hydrolase [Kingella kingae]MDK4542736.1 tannase/feruloyl esterase family alpha/beta hydrolase [Kingella kingae]MDK4562152.1 tannase/feruloyl esterase family alpha/beta hydrolase [Kingella kingae]